MSRRHAATRGWHARRAGVTLLDTIVGTALMLVIFLSIGAAFRLSVDVVSTNKARGGAIALADERMEYVRSLSYISVGTLSGVPSGTIPQSEVVLLNGVSYTRRTLILYADDPKDGLADADQNGITTDYKIVKVDIIWESRTGERHITLVSRINPPSGLETACTPPCGTLSVSVVDAASQPLSGASVTISNSTVSPAVNVGTFTNSSGIASLIGAPAGTGYAVIVSKTGYSTAQTYSVTAENTNPNPGNLTVSNGQTTSGTFAIDVLGQKIIKTWTQILPGTWTDPFDDAGRIASSTGIAVVSGEVQVAPGLSGGEVQSIAVGPSYLAAWKSAGWSDTQPAGTSIKYYVYDGAGQSLIPDTQIPGNSAGFTSGPIDLSGVSTTTYFAVRLDAVLSSTTSSPAIGSWSINYTHGPEPLPNIAFSLQGTKTIGSGPAGAVYKYSQSFDTGAYASIAIPNLEWDTYTATVSGTTGYDVASSCAPQPEALTPGGSLTTNLYLATHTSNSLLVNVRSSASGELITGASVQLQNMGYDTTLASDSCGQAFFSGLTASSAYTISVTAPGYTAYSASAIPVSGTTAYSVLLD